MAEHYVVIDDLALPARLSGHAALDFCNTWAGWDGRHTADYLESYAATIPVEIQTGRPPRPLIGRGAFEPRSMTCCEPGARRPRGATSRRRSTLLLLPAGCASRPTGRAGRSIRGPGLTRPSWL